MVMCNTFVAGGDQGRGAAWWGEWNYFEPGAWQSTCHIFEKLETNHKVININDTLPQIRMVLGIQCPRMRRQSVWGRRRRRRRRKMRSLKNNCWHQGNLEKCELLLIVHCSQVLVDLSDDEGGEEGGASKTKKEEPEDLGIPNVAVGWKTIIF